ncbi:unnamed protein product, partial [Mesorhabditis belari]|uniref:Uncharacterized protein n=1 Tax=Mesorhabditis belari TaxID=2138241 RepID=A0AAF3JA70_9BILA
MMISEISELVTENQQINDLTKHLLHQKIIEGWQLQKAIGNGSNGVVMLVEHTKNNVITISECNIINRLTADVNNDVNPHTTQRPHHQQRCHDESRFTGRHSNVDEIRDFHGATLLGQLPIVVLQDSTRFYKILRI